MLLLSQRSMTKAATLDEEWTDAHAITQVKMMDEICDKLIENEKQAPESDKSHARRHFETYMTFFLDRVEATFWPACDQIIREACTQANQAHCGVCELNGSFAEELEAFCQFRVRSSSYSGGTGHASWEGSTARAPELRVSMPASVTSSLPEVSVESEDGHPCFDPKL